MWVDIFENICPSVKYLNKKRKSESRLAPALPSPDATVGDLARTHCSTAVLQDWVLQMQSMVTYSQTAVANSSPMLFSAPSDKHERIYPWSTSDVLHFKCSYQLIFICARAQVIYSAWNILISFGKVLSIYFTILLQYLLFHSYHYQIILYI